MALGKIFKDIGGGLGKMVTDKDFLTMAALLGTVAATGPMGAGLWGTGTVAGGTAGGGTFAGMGGATGSGFVGGAGSAGAANTALVSESAAGLGGSTGVINPGYPVDTGPLTKAMTERGASTAAAKTAADGAGGGWWSNLEPWKKGALIGTGVGALKGMADKRAAERKRQMLADYHQHGWATGKGVSASQIPGRPSMWGPMLQAGMTGGMFGQAFSSQKELAALRKEQSIFNREMQRDNALFRQQLMARKFS